ncbi:hypothetical protein KR222_003168 [Zaprionus bogoriensis]|nr:hypothetical protein KR222_003168 [Zaprionus bogoriensis]
MNIARAKKELDSMPAIIKLDAKVWQFNIQRGSAQMQHYAKLCTKIFQQQQLLSEPCAALEERLLELQLNRLFRRLERSNSEMEQILDTLRDIKERTERMWRRVRLWNGDTCLRQHCIIWELNSLKLQDTLQFLSLRYDCEWEVKEMVVLELPLVANDYDVQILLQAWSSNRHAGGQEFNRQLELFHRLMGQRHCVSSAQLLYFP